MLAESTERVCGRNEAAMGKGNQGCHFSWACLSHVVAVQTMAMEGDWRDIKDIGREHE